MTILIIGFGPFPGAPRNPSADLARALARRRRPYLAGTRRIAVVLPTVYAEVTRRLPALLARHDPELVLFFGLAGRARAVRIESRAVRAASPLHPDAAGASPPRDLFPPGPHSLEVRAPVARLVKAARAFGVSARRSRDAGRYLCNAALYHCLAMARGGRPRTVAFVHIPWPAARSPVRRRKTGAHPTRTELLRAGEAVLRELIAHASQG